MFAIVDIYSRYVVHADVFDSESAENAVKFLEDAIKKHHIKPRALVLHSDNGAAMKAASTLALLARYEVESSRSRPRVSNDNPYSESLFKTMKYRGYMGKRQYRSLGDAKTKLAEFVEKYNEEWVHSGINNVTPESRFKGYDGCIQTIVVWCFSRLASAIAIAGLAVSFASSKWPAPNSLIPTDHHG